MVQAFLKRKESPGPVLAVTWQDLVRHGSPLHSNELCLELLIQFRWGLLTPFRKGHEFLRRPVQRANVDPVNGGQG